MFDDIKHGIYMNEQAIQKNTEMIKQIYKKYKDNLKNKNPSN